METGDDAMKIAIVAWNRVMLLRMRDMEHVMRREYTADIW